MEERLWSYIDGTCSNDERDTVAALIEQDDRWKNSYYEILQFNKAITELTPDEPSMAFGYKVMEGIRAVEASKPLKTAANKYIIIGIIAFFGISIITILLFFMNGVMQSVGYDRSGFIKFPDMSILMNSAVIKVFFYVDVMLLMFFADAWLRKLGGKGKIKSVQN